MGQQQSSNGALKGQAKSGGDASGSGFWDSYAIEVQKSQKSQIDPFYKSQLAFLQKLFQFLDRKSLKSIQLQKMSEIQFLRLHPLCQRIMVLFEEELKKIKTKKINNEIFLHLLSVFHFETDIQIKYKYLFRMYDFDKDFKLNHNDIVQTFGILFREKVSILRDEGIKSMASEAITRYGTKGQIKLQNFIELIHEDELKQMMTFRFNKKYW